MALKIGAFAYVECSAKNMEGVNEVFETAVRAALLVTSILLCRRVLLAIPVKRKLMSVALHTGEGEEGEGEGEDT